MAESHSGMVDCLIRSFSPARSPVINASAATEAPPPADFVTEAPQVLATPHSVKGSEPVATSSNKTDANQVVALVELEPTNSRSPSAKQRPGAIERIKKLSKLKKSKKPDTQTTDGETGPGEADIVLEVVTKELLQNPAEGATSAVPEPQTLARKIRILIVSLPAQTHDPVPKTEPPECDPSGKPIPPPSPAPIKDSSLIKLLSDPHIMNGYEGRPSIWSLLESLQGPNHASLPIDKTPAGHPASPVHVEVDGDVMLYCPLYPTDDSEIELAKSKLVSIMPSAVEHPHSSQSKWKAMLAAASWQSKPSLIPPKMVKKWVPSTTKISFQAMWWGYRMYLPTPVISSLDDREVKAVKIAAAITTALTWFLTHIPATVLPPPLQPAFLLLQKLAPYVGYIGTFVSWAWGGIKKCDNGYGVVLTATWLLPVALIPDPMSLPGTTPARPPSPEPNVPATTTSETTVPITSPPIAASPAPGSTPDSNPAASSSVAMCKLGAPFPT